MMSKKMFFLSVGLIFFLAGCHSVRRGLYKRKCCGYGKSFAGKAEIKPVAGQGPSGTAIFQKAGRHKVKVTAKVTGLPPNRQFGFHVHEWGNCGNKALMAGGHFNPWKGKHGGVKGRRRHLGDLGNLASSEKGEALYKAVIHGKVKKFLGRAVVIHAGKDDLKTPPSGNSGARAACGVIVAAPASKPDKAPKKPAAKQPAQGAADAALKKPAAPALAAPQTKAQPAIAEKPAAPASAPQTAAKPAIAKKPAAPASAPQTAAKPAIAEKPAAAQPGAARKPAQPAAEAEAAAGS